MSRTASPELLSVSQFAARIGVSRRTAYSMVSAGEVPVVRIRGVLRVPEAALQTWLDALSTEALGAMRTSI